MGAEVILDTDMGPDCDDAGALAVLHALADQGKVTIVGVTYCTSIPTGPGCVDAINRFYGRPDIPVGALSRDEFLRGPQYEKYTPFVASHFDNRFRCAKAPDAVAVLRGLLAAKPDDSIDVVGIGPLVNLADLLDSGPDSSSPLDGIALVGAKARRLVAMAGNIAPNDEGRVTPEWNVMQDLRAARRVLPRETHQDAKSNLGATRQRRRRRNQSKDLPRAQQPRLASSVHAAANLALITR